MTVWHTYDRFAKIFAREFDWIQHRTICSAGIALGDNWGTSVRATLSFQEVTQTSGRWQRRYKFRFTVSSALCAVVFRSVASGISVQKILNFGRSIANLARPSGPSPQHLSNTAVPLTRQVNIPTDPPSGTRTRAKPNAIIRYIWTGSAKRGRTFLSRHCALPISSSSQAVRVDSSRR